MNAAPNASPATACPPNINARLPADAPPTMPSVPITDAEIPMVNADRGGTRASATPATTETAGAMKPATPSSRPLSRPNTLCTMLGARPPESPASIHTAATTGAEARKGRRTTGGTEIRGISERSAPGSPPAVSGEATTAAPPATVSALRATNAIVLADDVSWIAMPASNEPPARPPVRPTLARIVPSRPRCGGASSTSAAVKAPVAAPLARPCTTRPAITHPTSDAPRNMRLDTSWTSRAPISTGRRPM
nr:hypothetical protein [Solirubrobacter pauli]